MLSSPAYGWTTFQLSEDRSYSLGYLTDIALDWLTQAIHGLETMDVFAVHGFCEPGRIICTVSYWSCYIIYEDENRNPNYENTEQHYISMIDFCKSLYSDISSDFNAWVHWDDSSMEYLLEDESDNEEYQSLIRKREMNIQNKLDTLKLLIEENEKKFGDKRCFF